MGPSPGTGVLIKREGSDTEETAPREDTETYREKAPGDRGGYWSHVSTSQGHQGRPAAPRGLEQMLP